jgi:casein kinase II subunit beta
LRPESPEELEHVDWRGRWIDEDDDYDDEEEEEEEEDRQMEDFDPVRILTKVLEQSWSDGSMVQDADEDEEEEEEEEEVSNIPTQSQGKRHIAEIGSTLRAPTPTRPSSSARTSAVSSAVPQTPRDSNVPVSVSTASLCNVGKVRVIKQWTPDVTWASMAKTW